MPTRRTKQLQTFVVALLLLCVSPTLGCAQDADLDAGLALLRSGSYSEARTALRAHVGSMADSSGLATVGYLKTFLETGDYEEGTRAAIERLAVNPDDPYALYMQGRLLHATGKLREADASYRRAAALKRNYWRNAVSLGELLLETGRLREANQIFATILSAYRQGYFKTSETLAAAGRSAAFVDEFRNANNAFNTAHDLDPRNTENLVWWADIFREKYNNADAERTYLEAIAVNGNLASAWVGLAHNTGSFAAKEEHINRALAANPNNVSALAIQSSLRILDGQYDEADAILNKALATNPASMAALAHRAAVQYLRVDTTGFRQTETTAMAINDASATFYTTIADDLALRFRYPDAAEISQKAVNVSPRDAKALASLGTSLLRLGRVDDAKRYLERAFERDQFNLFVGNTLTLLDEYADFNTLESEHFRLLIHKEESEVLGEEILGEAERAYASMSARYPYRPAGKIVVEAYNDRDDFAVRIAGVPHLGLLGVSFGDVVAINTPKAQSGSEYNWARTLWHEIGHTMAIGVSRNHVPRWFTEGLAVYEEKLAHPEWGRELELELFTALDRDALHPLENIDRGFTRPEFPGQVLLSYFHASKVIEYISDQYGFDAIVAIMTGLSRGESMAAAIQSATGVSQNELDAAFLADLRSQRSTYAALLDDLPDPMAEDAGDKLAESGGASTNRFLTALRNGREALANGDLDRAERQFRQSIELYPTFVHSGNGYEGLAEVYRQRAETSALESVLGQFLSVSDHGAAEAVELASLLKARGDLAATVPYLERSLFVDPYNRAVRSELADAYARLNDMPGAIRQRRAILALNPVDRAEAYFNLADVLYQNGQTTQAKRAVLQSLELAPGYREAQQLLLKCVEG